MKFGVVYTNSDVREVLSAARTYYVSKTGDDSFTGLTNVSGTANGAFLTIQKAMTTVGALDTGGYAVTVKVGAGTWAVPVVLPTVIGVTTTGQLIFEGDTSTPANVIINVTGSCVTSPSVKLSHWTVKGFKLIATASGFSVGGGYISFSEIEFGLCGGAQMYVSNGTLVADSNFSVSANGWALVQADQYAFVNLYNRTITFSNSPVYTITAYIAYYALCYMHSMTFTNGNTVTGTRYVVGTNGLLLVNGGGANYVPGNVAGSVSGQGQYI